MKDTVFPDYYDFEKIKTKKLRNWYCLYQEKRLISDELNDRNSDIEIHEQSIERSKKFLLFLDYHKKENLHTEGIIDWYIEYSNFKLLKKELSLLKSRFKKQYEFYQQISNDSTNLFEKAIKI